MKKSSLLSTLLFLICLSPALAQSWTQSIYVNTSGTTSAHGFFGASGTGTAGIYFDGSNGDFVGSDYASLLQMDDLSVQLSSSGSNPIFFKTLSTDRMTILGNGNVGIGTSNPSYKLTINSSNENQLRFENGSENAFFRLQNDGNLNLWVHGDDNMIFTRGTGSGTESMRIDPTGNVGIGNSSPEYLLDVSRANHNVARFVSTGTNSGPDVLIVDEDNTSNRASLQVQGNGGTIESLFVGSTGNVGIGTTSPDEKLTVKGTIHAEEVKVDLSVPGPDYVFEEDYNLRTLEETEAYIKANKHLPEIPSAKEMEANGVQLGEMNMLLLKKIEELTLHLITKEKEMESLRKEHQEKIDSLTERIEQLEKK